MKNETKNQTTRDEDADTPVYRLIRIESQTTTGRRFMGRTVQAAVPHGEHTGKNRKTRGVITVPERSEKTGESPDSGPICPAGNATDRTTGTRKSTGCVRDARRKKTKVQRDCYPYLPEGFMTFVPGNSGGLREVTREGRVDPEPEITRTPKKSGGEKSGKIHPGIPGSEVSIAEDGSIDTVKEDLRTEIPEPKEDTGGKISGSPEDSGTGISAAIKIRSPVQGCGVIGIQPSCTTPGGDAV